MQAEKVGIVVVALEEMGFEDNCYKYFFAGGNELHLNLLFLEDQVKIFHSFDVLWSQIFEYLFQYLCFYLTCKFLLGSFFLHDYY